MNYRKIYAAIIENAKTKNRITDEYTERHHIIPRSLGGLNDDENIVRLTAREHFIAHRLLAKMFPTDKKAKAKMVYAQWILSHGLVKKKKIKISSRVFAKMREEYSINNPQRDKDRRARTAANRAAGLYEENFHIGNKKRKSSMKKMLSALTPEERSIRMKKSALTCDQKEKGLAIQRGKSSILKLWLNETDFIEFNSMDAISVVGENMGTIRYRIDSYNGILKDGRKIEYVKRYGKRNNSCGVEENEQLESERI